MSQLNVRYLRHYLMLIVGMMSVISIIAWGISFFAVAPVFDSPLIIKSVQAKPEPTAKILPAQLPQTQRTLSRQTVKLSFSKKAIQLTHTEQQRLLNQVDYLGVSPKHHVEVMVGTTVTENQLLAPQLAKLRAQTVARLLFPHTQLIKLRQHKRLPAGQVIVVITLPVSSQ